jgi:hypothetical protein
MLTDSARNKILELLADFKRQFGKDAVPGIVWVDAALNQGRVQSGIGIGFYTDRAEIEADIQNVDGLEIVLAVADEDKVRFVGKVVDYVDGFVLRSAAI